MKPVDLGTFSENVYATNSIFTDVDVREFLYSDNAYQPTTSLYPIVWEDEDCLADELPDIIDKGDRVVNSIVAEKIMAFDPYGVEIYPARLKVADDTVEGRYLMSVKNVIDVLDENESFIEISPASGRVLVHNVFISDEKLLKVPLYKRLVFRVKGADDTIFFDGRIIDAADKYFSIHGAKLIQITPFNTSEEAPIL